MYHYPFIKTINYYAIAVPYFDMAMVLNTFSKLIYCKEKTRLACSRVCIIHFTCYPFFFTATFDFGNTGFASPLNNAGFAFAGSPW